MKVGIIGAGPSGLVAARYLKDHCSEVDIYERRNRIGGTWRCEDNSGGSPDGNVDISPVYDNLCSNSPIEGLKFEGLDYDCESECFISADKVKTYLKKYAEKFELNQYISLETEVTNVSWANGTWKVKSYHLPSGRRKEKEYNAVLLCNGHEDIPCLPQFEGASSFSGIQIHSKMYKNADKFQNQNVLLIGAGPSGTDISLRLSPAANQVYLSHHRELTYKATFPPNITQKPDIKRINKNSVTFVDGSTAEIDSIIYCTGYDYNFDFLDESCGISLVRKKYVKNLYKDTFCIEHPTLIFCGLLGYYYMFPILEFQAKAATQVLTGAAKLPSKEEMMEDIKRMEEKRRLAGESEETFYRLKIDGNNFLKELCEVTSLPAPPPALLELFEIFFYWYGRQPALFRKNYYKIIDSKLVYKQLID